MVIYLIPVTVPSVEAFTGYERPAAVKMNEAGVTPLTYWTIQNDHVELTDAGVIEESLVNIYVNGQEMATLMCSPLEQEALAIGFLFNEGVIDSIDAIEHIQTNVAGTVVDVFLKKEPFTPPRRIIRTSGCGNGTTLRQLADDHPALDTPFATQPDVVLSRMRDLHGQAHLYQQVRGVHNAGLATESTLMVSAEDVGRHNAIDKVTGKALLAGIDTHDCMILTSGRISSEVLGKAWRLGVPLIVSRTSPTSIAIELAQAWTICIVGYVRQNGMRVYTHPERLGLLERIVPQ